MNKVWSCIIAVHQRYAAQGSDTTMMNKEIQLVSKKNIAAEITA